MSVNPKVPRSILSSEKSLKVELNNNSYHLLSSCYMPATLLSTFHELAYLALTNPEVDTVIIPFNR